MWRLAMSERTALRLCFLLMLVNLAMAVIAASATLLPPATPAGSNYQQPIDPIAPEWPGHPRGRSAA